MAGKQKSLFVSPSFCLFLFVLFSFFLSFLLTMQLPLLYWTFFFSNFLLLWLIPNSRRTCTQEWEQKPVISLKLWTEQDLSKRQLRKRQLREYISSIYANAFLIITNAALRNVNGTLIQNTSFLGITAAPCVCCLVSHAKNIHHVLSIYTTYYQFTPRIINLHHVLWIYTFIVFNVHKNNIIMQVHQHCSYDVDI